MHGLATLLSTSRHRALIMPVFNKAAPDGYEHGTRQPGFRVCQFIPGSSPPFRRICQSHADIQMAADLHSLQHAMSSITRSESTRFIWVLVQSGASLSCMRCGRLPLHSHPFDMTRHLRSWGILALMPANRKGECSDTLETP